MDLSNSTVKTPEAETETPTRIPPAKLSPFSNGLLKRHAPLHHLHLHHHHHGHHPVVVTYKECLKNHAAALGGHALDGCGEFMPASNSINSDPTSYKCAACGCHRNFHRRDPEDSPPLFHPPPPLEFYPHHRHHPARGGESGGDSPSDSPSPPPISSSYYPSAPHMLLSLSHGLATAPDGGITHIPAAIVNPTSTPASNSGGRKRFRTRFTQDQKEKMLELADRLGWRMQKKDEDLINEFCGEIGIDKGVFKVWMHNNKNTSGKNKDQHQLTLSNNSAVMSSPPAAAAVNNGTNYIDFRSSAAAAAAALYHQQDSNNDSCSKQEMNQLHLQD